MLYVMPFESNMGMHFLRLSEDGSASVKHPGRRKRTYLQVTGIECYKGLTHGSGREAGLTIDTRWGVIMARVRVAAAYKGQRIHEL